MFWIIGTDRKPKPAERGASQYAKPAEAPDAMPGYVPDERDRDYALQQLSTLPQYSSEQPGALAIPVPQPRHRFPWEYVFLGTAAVLALAAGTVYVASYLNNRPNAGYKAPAVRTIEKPVNAPTLVAEPGFRTPLAPTATAVPKATATPQPYRPIGDFIETDYFVLDCPPGCTPEQLQQYADILRKPFVEVEKIFGTIPKQKPILQLTYDYNPNIPKFRILPRPGQGFIIGTPLGLTQDDFGTNVNEIYHDFRVLSHGPSWDEEGGSNRATARIMAPMSEYSETRFADTYRMLKHGIRPPDPLWGDDHDIGNVIYAGLAIDYGFDNTTFDIWEKRKVEISEGEHVLTDDDLIQAAYDVSGKNIKPLIELAVPYWNGK